MLTMTTMARTISAPIVFIAVVSGVSTGVGFGLGEQGNAGAEPIGSGDRHGSATMRNPRQWLRIDAGLNPNSGGK